MFFEAEIIVFNFFSDHQKNSIVGDMTSRSLIIQSTIKEKNKPKQNTSYSKMALETDYDSCPEGPLSSSGS